MDDLRDHKSSVVDATVDRLKDQEKVKHEHISTATRNNVWMALECARLSRDILGRKWRR